MTDIKSQIPIADTSPDTPLGVPYSVEGKFGTRMGYIYNGERIELDAITYSPSGNTDVTYHVFFTPDGKILTVVGDITHTFAATMMTIAENETP